MGLYFSNEYYRKKALETKPKNGNESKHSVGEAFSLLVKDVPKEDLSNLILMVKEHFETLTKPVSLSLDDCYHLIQGKSVNGIEMDESTKMSILELAYKCIESGKNLGEKTIQNGKINTSNWMGHVLYASKFAGELASKLNIDVKTAQIQGMLHDYGRKISHGFEHVINGYEKLIDEGWEEEAVACLSHSFLNGGRCASNEQAEEGFYVDEAGYPAWKEGTKKDDITIFLENYKYNQYDRILNIADLVATSSGIVSPYERIEDIATRRKLDPTNRAYFLAEFTNQLVEILRETGGNISPDLAGEIKATPDVTIDEMNQRLKKVSDLFFEHYKKEISLDQNFAKVSPQEIARLSMQAKITTTELNNPQKIITSINHQKGEEDDERLC